MKVAIPFLWGAGMSEEVETLAPFPLNDRLYQGQSKTNANE